MCSLQIAQTAYNAQYHISLGGGLICVLTLASLSQCILSQWVSTHQKACPCMEWILQHKQTLSDAIAGSEAQPKRLKGPWTLRYINVRSQQWEFFIDSFNLLYRINDLEECIRFLSQMLLIEGWSSKRMQPLHIKAVPHEAQWCN